MRKKLTSIERAALERLRADNYADHTDYLADGPRVLANFSCQKMLDSLACYVALLRIVPADDELALDKGWLRAVGGKQEDHPQKILFEREDAMPIGLWSVDDGWKAMLIHAPYASSCIVRGLKTRGDLRRLASAIGINLEEPA